MMFTNLVLYGSLSMVLIFFVLLVYWMIYPIRVARKFLLNLGPPTERQYIDYKSGKERKPFSGTLKSPSTVYLSVIIPAYNEEERIRPMLESAIEYLARRQRNEKDFTYEIIIVDDCSQDKTIERVIEIMRKHQSVPVKLLTLEENHGKGGAVRKGMLMASGLLLLMADADGATTFQDVENLENEAMQIMKRKFNEERRQILKMHLENEEILVCGSRAHLQEIAAAKRHWLRNLLMYGFHFAVSLLCIREIKDTQCGFKLFTRNAAQLVFPPLHIERWAFDVELLFLAGRQGVQLGEVPVEWKEIPGSKLNVVTASLTMLREICLIRLCYATGIWSMNDGLQRLV